MAAAEAEEGVPPVSSHPAPPASEPHGRGRTRQETAAHRKGQPENADREESVEKVAASRGGTGRCPSCGAKELTDQELVIARRPGRRCQRDASDPRNRPENLVTEEFLRQHIVGAHMSLRDIGSFHGYTISTLSRRAKQYGIVLSKGGKHGVEAHAAAAAASQGEEGEEVAAGSETEGTWAAAKAGPKDTQASKAGGAARKAAGAASGGKAARKAGAAAAAAAGKQAEASGKQRVRSKPPGPRKAAPAKPAAAKRRADPAGPAGKRSKKRVGSGDADGTAALAVGADRGVQQQDGKDAEAAPAAAAAAAPQPLPADGAYFPFGAPAFGIPFMNPALEPLVAVPHTAAPQPHPSVFEAWAAQHQQPEAGGSHDQQGKEAPEAPPGEGAQPRPATRQAIAGRGDHRGPAPGAGAAAPVERKELPPRKRRRTARYGDGASEGEASLGGESDVDSDGVDAFMFLVADALRASQQEDGGDLGVAEEQPKPDHAGGWAASQEEAGPEHGGGGATPERLDAAAIGSEEQQLAPLAASQGQRLHAAAASGSAQQHQQASALAADAAPGEQAATGPAAPAQSAIAERPAGGAARAPSRRKQKPAGPAASGLAQAELAPAGAGAGAAAPRRRKQAAASARHAAARGKASATSAAAAAPRSAAPVLRSTAAKLVVQCLHSAEAVAGAPTQHDGAAAASGRQAQQQAAVKADPWLDDRGGHVQAGAAQPPAPAQQAASGAAAAQATAAGQQRWGQQQQQQAVSSADVHAWQAGSAEAAEQGQRPGLQRGDAGAPKQDQAAHPAAVVAAEPASGLAGQRAASPRVHAEGRGNGQKAQVKQEAVASRSGDGAAETAPAPTAPAAAGSAGPATAAATVGAASGRAATEAAAVPASLPDRQEPACGLPASPTAQPSASAATSAPAAPALGPAASSAPSVAPAGAPSLATAPVTAAATAHVLGKALDAFQRADMGDAHAMLRPLHWLSVAGNGGELLADYVRRWHSLPAELQRDLFSTSLLVAQQGTLHRLEEVLRMELG